ncbi:MAG: hypothetical protein WDN28_09645 [Chthoniobacter sp.]
MSKTMLCLARHGLVVALFISLGGHWAVLQSIAWTCMFVEYSQESSVKEAVVKTFDGNHPCELCKSLSKSRTGKSSGESQVIKKTEMIHYAVAALFYGTGPLDGVEVTDWAAPAFAPEPSVPPPRLG